MPVGHKSNCACSVCAQKRNGVSRQNSFDRKREAIAKMQESHRKVKGMSQWAIAAQYTEYGAAVAYNVARIALWAIPTCAGIFALLRFVWFLFSL